MVKCNENENDDGKMDDIKEIRQTDQDVDIKANIQNMACLGKSMPLCNKQHLSDIRGSIY